MAARMVAMKAPPTTPATSSASCKLIYNKARQAAITKEFRNTGKPIKVPVGKGTLGRIMDVLGDPIDEARPGRPGLTADPPQAPTYDEQRVAGTAGHRHQGHRPALPVRQGRQGRPVRRRRRRQDRQHQELINNIAKAHGGCRCSPASASAPAKATTSITR
jgi:hypothetical protein